ncbi:MAG: hypothetical protein CEE38_21920 [Planctomycetes bacterium B3_Pla]|nr:MAG: hypothetical protein CEE38_21920 [Planctomycetes bacterium B3_Pla]
MPMIPDGMTTIPVFVIEPYKQGGQHRGNVLVKLQGENLYTDDINLFSQKSRRRLIKAVSQKTGLVEDQIESEFLRRLALLLQDNKEAESEPAETALRKARDIPYGEDNDGIFWLKSTKDGSVTIPLTNFTAKITRDILSDDGVEESHLLEIEASLKGRQRRFMLSASKFSGMAWPVEQLGAEAMIYPGYTAKDHARAAIQLLSIGSIVSHRVYTHTGWCESDGQSVYLHSAGALGAKGLIEGVETDLGGNLSHYTLPAPPKNDDLRKAIHANLRILDLVPDKIAWPLFCLPWCAILGLGSFTCHIHGYTGIGKTQLAALIQQHFGSQMKDMLLPGSWNSTHNALERLAFSVKDAVLVIDDFAPSGSPRDLQEIHRKATYITRSQANRAARQRMRSDTTLRSHKPPRGMILSTGEDVFWGQSVRARTLIVDLGQQDLNWQQLSLCQEDADAGLYAQTTSAFIRWLAARYNHVRDKLNSQVNMLRDRASKSNQHKRMSTTLAALAAGACYFLEFAEQNGAITGDEKFSLFAKCWSALGEASQTQFAYQVAVDPVRRFQELLVSALASGHAHVAGRHGGPPLNEEIAWGWREKTSTSLSQEPEWQSQGFRIGWVDDEALYLDPDASYKAVQSMATTGEGISITRRTLQKRLYERRLITVEGKRETLTVRRRLEDRQRNVLCMRKESLESYALTQSDTSEESALSVPEIKDMMSDVMSGFKSQMSGCQNKPDTKNPT